MIRRLGFNLPLRVFTIGALALVIAGGLLLHEHEAPGAFADPAYGNVRLSPQSQFVIVGHKFSIPVQLTTCTDVQGTATGGTSTTLTDTSKAWTTNQWSGNSLLLTSGSGSPQTRTVASNTSNTLTLSQPFGIIVTGSATGQDIGTATSATASDIIDSTRDPAGTPTNPSWTPNQWHNFVLTLTAGTGSPQTRTVASNTEFKLTVSPPWGTILVNGTATGATTTTLVDTPKTWTVNQWAGKNVDLLSGIGAPQTASIVSNTSNTLTISAPWTSTPTSGTTYDIRQTLSPGAGTAYQVGQNSTTTTLVNMRASYLPNEFAGYAIDLLTGTGSPQTRTVSSNTSNTLTISSPWTSPIPVAATTYQLRQTTNLPGSSTGYTLGKCRPGGYGVTITYDPAKFSIASDAGTSTGVNTTTVLNDTTKVWKINQWAGSRLTLTGGPASGDLIVLSNTANSITVSTPFTGTPDATSTYKVGGITDAGTLGSTGRPVTCPIGGTYGANWAELHCFTTGLTPAGPIGAVPLVNVVFSADVKGKTSTFSLVNGPASSSVLTLDAQTIPADMIAGTRRVILCPDPAPSPNGNNYVNVLDLQSIATALNSTVGDPLYNVKKDPDENNYVNVIDLSITAGLLDQRCVQQ